MKIRSVNANNRRKVFEVRTSTRTFDFSYSKAHPRPTAADPIASVVVDKELGREAFTYVLKSGLEGSVHIDHVLDYNRDPTYMRDMLLYKLTLEAKKRVESSPLAKRELIRRLATSATQFYRLLDPTNRRKSIDQMLSLLQLLDCTVDLKVRTNRPVRHAA